MFVAHVKEKDEAGVWWGIIGGLVNVHMSYVHMYVSFQMWIRSIESHWTEPWQQNQTYWMLRVTRVFKLFRPVLCLFSHESHDPAHREDGGRRSRRRPRGDALLLQGKDGQPRPRRALHKGRLTACLTLASGSQFVPEILNTVSPKWKWSHSIKTVILVQISPTSGSFWTVGSPVCVCPPCRWRTTARCRWFCTAFRPTRAWSCHWTPWCSSLSTQTSWALKTVEEM